MQEVRIKTSKVSKVNYNPQKYELISNSMRNENSTHGFNSYQPPTDITMQNVQSSYDSLYQEENFINNDEIEDDY